MLFKISPLQLFSWLAVVVALTTPLRASPLQETVNTLEKWVETERMISKAKAEWESNRASMENLISIYKREIEALSEIIASAEKDMSAAEVRRAELTSQDEAVKAIEAEVTEAIIGAEIALKELQPILPPPLREELQPAFSSIPDDPKSSKQAIGQRIQSIVAILTQVQKFNQVVTLVEDFREFEDEQGRTVQTETVYFGLGTAFYVDQANAHAGMGRPGPGGWEWTSNDELIPSIRSFIDIYRGTQQARYVEVPVEVK